MYASPRRDNSSKQPSQWFDLQCITLHYSAFPWIVWLVAPRAGTSPSTSPWASVVLLYRIIVRWEKKAPAVALFTPSLWFVPIPFSLITSSLNTSSFPLVLLGFLPALVTLPAFHYLHDRHRLAFSVFKLSSFWTINVNTFAQFCTCIEFKHLGFFSSYSLISHLQPKCMHCLFPSAGPSSFVQSQLSLTAFHRILFINLGPHHHAFLNLSSFASSLGLTTLGYRRSGTKLKQKHKKKGGKKKRKKRTKRRKG